MPNCPIHATKPYYTDVETGLSLCTFRYYDAATGRWINRDPIGYDGSINLYGYCGNDSIGSIDPSGLTDKRSELGGLKSGQVVNNSPQSVNACFDWSVGKKTYVVRVNVPKGYETNPRMADVDYVQSRFIHFWIKIKPTVLGSVHATKGKDGTLFYKGPLVRVVPQDPNFPDFPSDMGVGFGTSQRPPIIMDREKAERLRIIRRIRH